MTLSEATGFLGTCHKHFAERAVAQCHDCGRFWCGDCLVIPVSNRQPLRCVDCALVAGGVRARGPRRAPLTEVKRTKRR